MKSTKRILLPGSETYWEGYSNGLDLDARFPASCAEDFSSCIAHTGGVPVEAQGVAIVKLVCLQEGQPDERDWIWNVYLADGSKWAVTGGCDFTGWDCQAYSEWENYDLIF